MNIFIMYGILFYAGATFIRDYDLTLSDMLTAMFGIVFAAFAGGNASHFMPDVAAAYRVN